MAWLVILGVIALPVIEIWLWVRSADWIGVLPTIMVSVGAVMIGMAILRRQGLATLLDARARLDRGEMPMEAAFDGLCLAAAGFLLLLPGFLTDALALPLLLPPVRRWLRAWVARRAVVERATPPGVIDGDFIVIEPEAPPDHKRLGP